MTTSLMQKSPSRKNRAGLISPRVAIVGCGAMTRSFHLPVLAGCPGVRLAALVDRDLPRARALAADYNIPTVLQDAADLDAANVDAAVIATPPGHHAPCSIALLNRGIHVLVEKPMAITAADASAMVAAAQTAGMTLSAGYFRRLLPNVHLLGALIHGGVYGRPVKFDAEEGGEYTWGLASLGGMRKDQGGGGVLIDIGSHVLDVLLYLFPGPVEVLDYGDNALGGIETDCLLRLRVHHGSAPVDGRIELSRTRTLRGTLRVVCEHATLELRTGERMKVAVIPHDLTLHDPALGTDRPLDLAAAWADEPEHMGYEGYRAEIDDWLQAIQSGEPPLLSGASALPTVELIERCYQHPRRIEEPWVWHGLPLSACAPAAPAGQKSSPGRRVLITGASGFIGGRVAEVLHLSKTFQVRALVHNPGSAARLARLPIEMVQGDLKSPEDMARAVADCDAVVHCAIGTAYGQPREIYAVTVEGTRLLTQAALAAGVKRFVHLSSIAVHGNKVEGILDESTPVQPNRRDDYADSKAQAEQMVEKAVRAGLPAIVLRPGCVYGPFGKTFSVRPIQFLRRGQLVLAGSADLPSNTVYVDNVVYAIVRALGAPAEVANGQAFTISEGDDLTWAGFYGYFANAIEATLQIAPPEEVQPATRQWNMGPLAWPGSWFRAVRLLATSAEFRALGKLALRTDPLGRLPRWVLERFPSLDSRVRRLVGTDSVMIYRRPTPTAPEVMKVRARPILVKIDKARRLLGYEPIVPRARAMELTLEWIRHARLG